MKKILTLVIAAAALFAYSAAQAQEFILDAKAGTAYSKDPGAFGFNSALELGIGVNPYFEILAMPGFTWFNWDQGLGIMKQDGTLTTELKSSVDGYMFPVLGGFKIRLADAKESIGITPYITGAAGYTWMRYVYSTPEYTPPASTVPVPKKSGRSVYEGFTWTALGGFTYEFPNTGMSLLAEAGYRGAKLEKGSYELDMSGFVANVGVSFAFGGSND